MEILHRVRKPGTAAHSLVLAQRNERNWVIFEEDDHDPVSPDQVTRGLPGASYFSAATEAEIPYFRALASQEFVKLQNPVLA